MKLMGYLHPEYAASFSQFGKPIEMSNSRGWILMRGIDGSQYQDASGCYPFFACQDWSKLAEDLNLLSGESICFSMVTDPFGSFSPTILREHFPDKFLPFKSHYIVDLHQPLEKLGTTNHRRNTRKALKRMSIEVVDQPSQFLEDWIRLYDVLIKRHNIRGIRAFSRDAFARQLTTPGAHVLRAVYNGMTVSAKIFYLQDEVVHSHLGATTDLGYELDASYALDWSSFGYFKDKASWMNLGGGAGLSNNPTDGLSIYKKSWATETRTTYFCGRIFDKIKYEEILRIKRIEPTSYFPAYRQGEYG